MKRIIAMLAMFLLLATMMVSAVDTPALRATLMKYEPQPAEPGKLVKVFVKLENVGTGTTKNTLLQIVLEYPFSLQPGMNDEEYVGLLGGGSFHVAEFLLKVDEKAVEGTNYLKVRYSLDENQDSWAEEELAISVQTQDAVLSIEEISTTPAEIAPGEVGTVNIRLKNLADSPLTDIKVKIDLSSTDHPFAPYNSATEKNIYQLEKDEMQIFGFDIIAYPSAEAKIYKVPLEIDYYDNVGNVYAREDLIGLIINSKPDIKVVVDSTTLLSEKKTGDVVLKIVNKGLNDVKLMNMVIGESEDFELLSSNSEQYIGNLDSDDFETVDFSVLIGEKDKVSIPISLEYMDNNNNVYEEDMKLKLTVHSAEKLGQAKRSKVGLYVVVILIIGGFFWYRRRKKKKQN